MLGPGLSTVDPVAPFYDVQIDLKYPSFSKTSLQHNSHYCFLPLSDERSLRRKIKVLSKLLSYRRSASFELWKIRQPVIILSFVIRLLRCLFLSLVPCFLNCLVIKSMVVDEVRIFTCEYSTLQID